MQTVSGVGVTAASVHTAAQSALVCAVEQQRDVTAAQLMELSIDAEQIHAYVISCAFNAYWFSALFISCERLYFGYIYFFDMFYHFLF